MKDKKDFCTLYLDGIANFNWGRSVCKPHDIAYRRQNNKFKADIRFLRALLLNAFVGLLSFLFLALTAIPAYLAVSTVGWVWYLKAKRKRNKLRKAKK